MVKYEMPNPRDDLDKLVRLLKEHPVSQRGKRELRLNPLEMEEIGEDGSRMVFQHQDFPEYVIKVAGEGGAWANENEIDISIRAERDNGRFTVPPEVHQHLAQVLEWDKSGTEPYWLIMQKADTESVDRGHGEFLWVEMKEEGWGVEDLHMDNIGLVDGKPVVIDYAYLKPIKTMIPKAKERVKSGSRWS